ncbi:MAG: hypothetical protein ABL936_04865 [Aestuariivirga sp.]
MFSGARVKSPQRITRVAVPVLPNFLSGNKNLQFRARIAKSKPISNARMKCRWKKIEILCSSQCHNDFFTYRWRNQQMQQCHSWSFPSGYA